MPIPTDIKAYNAAQAAPDTRLCNALAKVIDQNLPGSESKIWHAHPVWFLDGNPIVGYSKLKGRGGGGGGKSGCIRLLFWSGQSFDEPGLAPEGRFKAAEARYTSMDDIVEKDLKRWLKKAAQIQWDYKNIVKRKGKLERLDTTSAAKKTKAKTPTTAKKAAARSADSNDWRAATLEHVRRIIMATDKAIVEERKWKKPSNPAGVPTWSHPSGGIICTGETYKDKVKLTFARGAALADPSGLFNASLDGNVRRAIDIREGEKLNEAALKKLVRAAVAQNNTNKAPRSAPGTQRSRTPRLLSGDNPQIPKGDGDEPVRSYIDAIPGWKQDVARRLDALIVKAVPKSRGVRKAVKWNSPFYGAADQPATWFLSYHCFTRYVKVTFFRGTSLNPVPPGQSKHPEVRYLDIHEGWTDAEGAKIDEAQVTKWVKQASALPGEKL